MKLIDKILRRPKKDQQSQPQVSDEIMSQVFEELLQGDIDYTKSNTEIGLNEYLSKQTSSRKNLKKGEGLHGGRKSPQSHTSH